MQVLLKKDFTISAKYIFLSLAFSFFSGMTGYMVIDNMLAQGRFISIVFFAAQLVFIELVNADDKYNTDILLNSLALEKRDIVISRYIINLILPVIFGVSLFFFTRIYSASNSAMLYLTPENKFGFYMMIISIGINMIFLSFNLPIYYYSANRAQVISRTVSILALLAPLFFHNFLDKLGDFSFIIKYMDNKIFALAFLLISLVLYYVSMGFSTKFYNKKEF